MIDQICSEVKDCEVHLLDLLVCPLGWLEDCPFSLLYWIKKEIGLDEFFVKATEKILLQMFICPSLIYFGAETLLAVAFRIQTSNSGHEKLGTILNLLFAIREEEVNNLAFFFNQEVRSQPVEVLTSNFPDLSANFESIENMFNEDELSTLIRHNWSEIS